MAKRKTPGLNTQSTADIAFLLLCYFLMTSTMDQQAGLQRRLPPMPDKNQKVEDMKVNERNIIIVRINSGDRLFAGDQPMDVSQLKDKIKEFQKGRIRRSRDSELILSQKALFHFRMTVEPAMMLTYMFRTNS